MRLFALPTCKLMHCGFPHVFLFAVIRISCMQVRALRDFALQTSMHVGRSARVCTACGFPHYSGNRGGFHMRVSAIFRTLGSGIRESFLAGFRIVVHGVVSLHWQVGMPTHRRSRPVSKSLRVLGGTLLSQINSRALQAAHTLILCFFQRKSSQEQQHIIMRVPHSVHVCNARKPMHAVRLHARYLRLRMQGRRTGCAHFGFC